MVELLSATGWVRMLPAGRQGVGPLAQDHRQALPAGYRLHEYRIEEILGHGGFGLTYLGRDIHLAKSVAIKEYLPTDLAVREADNSVVPKSTAAVADFEWGRDRFLDEARALARFQHRNIVQIFRFFEAHGTAYIVMEFADGSPLSDLLARETLAEGELLKLVNPLLDGLDTVHRADFLHRDIKPANIIVRKDGAPVLIDFGAARQSIGARSRSVTSIVTPGYAPIEQYSTNGNQGPWTDIYAMGAVLYRAVTGKRPLDASERIFDDPLVPAVRAANGRFSRSFLAAIDAALAVRERDRPKSIAAWRAMLMSEPKVSQTQPKPATKPKPARNERGINVGPIRIVGAAVVVFMIAGGVYWWLERNATNPTPDQAQDRTVARATDPIQGSNFGSKDVPAFNSTPVPDATPDSNRNRDTARIPDPSPHLPPDPAPVQEPVSDPAVAAWEKVKGVGNPCQVLAFEREFTGTHLSALAKIRRLALDASFWKEAEDEAKKSNTRDAYRHYIDCMPDGKLVGLAKLRLENSVK